MPPSYEQEEYKLPFLDSLKLSFWVFKYIKPYWKMMSLSIALMIIVSVMGLFPTILTSNAINLYLNPSKYAISSKPSYNSIEIDGKYFIPSSNGAYTVKHLENEYIFQGNGNSYTISTSQYNKIRFSGISLVAFEIFMIFLVSFVFSYIQNYTSQSVGIRAVNDVRNQLFVHLIDQPMKFFDSNISGRLVTRVTNDVQNLNNMFSTMISSIFKDAVLIAGILYVLFLIDFRLFLITVPIFITVAIITSIFRTYSRKAYRAVRAKLAAINGFLAEHLSGMVVTVLFNREQEKSDEFSVINNDYYKAAMKQLLIFAFFRPLIDFLRYVGTALVIWFGVQAIIHGQMEIGTLYAFVSYIGMAFTPINDLAENFSNIQSAMVSIERIRALFKLPRPQRPISDEKINSGKTEVKNLWFGYSQNAMILKDVSFTVEDGGKLAIVGHTGAGKSTISSILTGLYPYSKGSVKIGGVEVKDCPIEELRKNVNIVIQEVMLFSGTVFDNIRLFDEKITKEMAIEAIKKLDIEKFIASLPNGIDTEVREGGNNLSMGQRQLISMIRTFVRQPKVVIMDEATSNVDVETESLIQRASERLTEGRTTIVIAHRLSTVRNIERIIVIDDGKIVEEGNHEELMKKDGIYAKLYQLQSFEEYKVS
ncbi:MAG: ABC transporter ATP-binding protein/permease [Thermotogae bacterium]|jgi:ABC-type multidrug transport system fused ATPase/permease subunit|nr:ABC transporter ATP-binding protein/permease [Thermotogota bacterium]MCL5032442.1 ABC transporter ATP-binding protein/permease [Thermotogota bacterium]